MSCFRKTKGAWSAVGILFFVGVCATAFRVIVRGRHGGVPVGDTVWKLTCGVKFHAQKEGAKVRIALPGDTTNIRVYGQDFTTPGLRQERNRGRAGITRDAVAVAFREGRASAEIELDLHLSPKPGWRSPPNGNNLTPDERVRLLTPEPQIQSDNAVVLETLRSLNAQIREPKVRARRIFDYCTQRIAFDGDSANVDALSTIQQGEGSSIGRSRAFIALCRAARIPARLVAGFMLEQRRDVRPHIWAEAMLEKKNWSPYDVEFGHAAALPANYLPMRRGGREVVRVTDGNDVEIRFGLFRQPTPRGLLAGGDRGFIEVFDLTRLPLLMQLSLSTLLMLPFGALLTTLFRNLIGVRTFGTFSPTLLGLAAVYAEWKTVTMIFALVIVIGIAGRSLLPGFKLMQVPRLSIVFTLVAVSMTLSVSLLDYFGLNPTGHIALLPMVVLTSLVDRIYAVADDDGMRVAAVRLCWTAAVGAICFSMFLWKGAGQLIIEFPEAHFVTIAVMLLLGLYKGPKLADQPLFAFLSEPRPEKEKNSKDANDGTTTGNAKKKTKKKTKKKKSSSGVADDRNTTPPEAGKSPASSNGESNPLAKPTTTE